MSVFPVTLGRFINWQEKCYHLRTASGKNLQHISWSFHVAWLKRKVVHKGKRPPSGRSGREGSFCQSDAIESLGQFMGMGIDKVAVVATIICRPSLSRTPREEPLVRFLPDPR